MSQRKAIQKALKKAGFKLIRSNKHFIYESPKGARLTVPNHNKMNHFTFKGILKQIEAGI